MMSDMTEQSREDMAAAGMTAASRALEALAQGDESLALAAINSTATHGESAWAAAYMMQAVRSAVSDLAGGNEARARLMFQTFADNMAEDIITTQARLIVDEEERRD